MMLNHGFDLSLPRSDNQNVTLFTREPYAAVTFIASATPAAQVSLATIAKQIECSRALDGVAIACPVAEELAGYQKASISYALSRTNTLIADEPGTGKTAEAICFANEIKARRCLVICPAAIRRQWGEAIRRWTLMQWPFVIHTINSKKDGVNPNANWTICSYDLARTRDIGAQIAAQRFDVGIFDEVHYLKTPDSARTRAIFGGGEDRSFDPLALSCNRLLALSGTPVPNRPREAYTLARGLCFDAIDWLSQDRFYERFNPSKRVERYRDDGSSYFWNDERTGRYAELQNRLRANFMARHLKRDVLTQLKLPIYDLVRAEETGPVRAALAAEKLLDLDPNQFTRGPDLFGGAVATVRRLMGEALALQVVTYADLLLTGGINKLVIFAWHKSVLDILEKGLHKWGVVRVDGNTSSISRTKAILDFQKEHSIHVIIGNLLSLGTGTDGLQNVSSNVIIAEPSWVPGENVQAIDRLDRLGQKRTVMADIFVAPNSFSEHVLATALRKGQIIHKSLDHIGG
jgi:SWI/SNF-related matrix-associated actin-dependent regulator 1 of chromatin subfamily A